VVAAISGIAFLGTQRRQAMRIKGMNRELESAIDFLATLSMKISRYISAQVYKSIFSGQKDGTIQTERKKLTIFFSDIQNFTATTERLQPELITQLLNEYFTEMSAIAHEHGGTIDKFIGDAMLIFFGDPETRGDRADAQACLRMAWSIQRRLVELNAKWRASGIEHPFKSRSESISATAMSVISAALIAWTTRLSARKPIWPRVCNRSRSRWHRH
jgi:adenylate cyclase